MLVLIPIIWMLLAFVRVGAIDVGSDGAHFRDSPSPTSVSVTGKPIKIPAKKV